MRRVHLATGSGVPPAQPGHPRRSYQRQTTSSIPYALHGTRVQELQSHGITEGVQESQTDEISPQQVTYNYYYESEIIYLFKI